jgi:hypothetical protein
MAQVTKPEVCDATKTRGGENSRTFEKSAGMAHAAGVREI